MRMIKIVSGPFLLMLCFTLSLSAQQVTHQAFLPTEIYLGNSFLINLDNDKFSGLALDEDRDYTNGIAFTLNMNKLNSSPFHKMNTAILSYVWKRFHPRRSEEVRPLVPLAAGLSLWGLTYTPCNIATTNVVYDDRPYAGVQLLDTRIRLFDEKLNRVHSLGIAYGTLATPVAEWAQRIVHTYGNIRPLPEGWSNQISDPWEPTLLVNYQRDRIWQSAKDTTNIAFADLRETISIDLGYRVVASFGYTGRIGAKWGEKDPSNFFIYARLRAFYVAYDATLQGQFRPSVHTLEFSDIKQLRGEFAIGVGTQWDFGKSSLMMGYGFYGMTPEAQYPNHIRNHNWGSFVLGWGFR